jgi:cytidine deaminase
MAEQKTLTIDYTIYNWSELPEQVAHLMEVALNALDSAYAPYSGFHVGSAVRLTDGIIVPGNNQENAAYPSGLCAERVALFAAKSANPDTSIDAIAIAAKPKDGDDYVSAGSCGNCRQVMIEYEHKQKKPYDIYLMMSDQKVLKINSAADYLPFSFNAATLLDR